jgi:hypothetical protein
MCRNGGKIPSRSNWVKQLSEDSDLLAGELLVFGLLAVGAREV